MIPSGRALGFTLTKRSLSGMRGCFIKGVGDIRLNSGSALKPANVVVVDVIIVGPAPPPDADELFWFRRLEELKIHLHVGLSFEVWGRARTFSCCVKENPFAINKWAFSLSTVKRQDFCVLVTSIHRRPVHIHHPAAEKKPFTAAQTVQIEQVNCISGVVRT